MDPSNTKVIDPICGMIVDTTTALHAERDGEKSYFCSERCREKFLSTPALNASPIPLVVELPGNQIQTPESTK